MKEANACFIYRYLTTQGWSKEAICAFWGNAEEESGLNPAIWEIENDLNRGYGIVQFTKYRDDYNFEGKN